MYYWFDARMVELTEFSLSIIWTRNRWHTDIGIIELMAGNQRLLLGPDAKLYNPAEPASVFHPSCTADGSDTRKKPTHSPDFSSISSNTRKIENSCRNSV